MKGIGKASWSIFIGIMLIVFLIAFYLFQTRSYSNPEDFDLTEIEFVAENSVENGSWKLVTGHFSQNITSEEVLYFWPDNIEVTMKVSGQVVYEFTNPTPIISSTPGSTIARVKTDGITTDDTVTIIMDNPWYQYTQDNQIFDEFLNVFAVGKPSVLYELLLRGNIIGIFSGMLTLFVGMLFLLYTLIYYVKRYEDAGQNFAFAFLCFCSGFYITNGAMDKLLPLVITNPVWCSMFKLFSSFLFPLSVMIYMRVIAKGKWANIIQSFTVLIATLAIICPMFLHIFGFYDIYQTSRDILSLMYVLLLVNALSTVVDGIRLKNEQVLSTLKALMPLLFASVLMTAVSMVTGNVFTEPMYLAAVICILIIAFTIASDVRTAERALVWMNKQIIKSNNELDRTLESLSVSKKQNSELMHEKEILQAQNQVDIMTGLFNKVAMRQVVSRYLENNNTENVALIFIDLDHFKNLNDTLGHAMGDMAIREAADKLSTTFRRYDLVSRFGGDEFCVFLRSIKMQDLVNKLELLTQVLKASYSDGVNTVHITGSIGCAYVMSSTANYDLLIEAADRAVYAAKTGGRNQYVLMEYYAPVDEGDFD